MGDSDCEILEKYENPINSHDEDNSIGGCETFETLCWECIQMWIYEVLRGSR
jgi:hypothetical protein